MGQNLVDDISTTATYICLFLYCCTVTPKIHSVALVALVDSLAMDRVLGISRNVNGNQPHCVAQ